uniref:Uroporphyrinogen-III synthase n=1 Tax=Lygus hesperus TaxID=30085 RepID=A0A0A9XBQ0_LYGHE
MVRKHAILFKAGGDDGNPDVDPYAGTLGALDIDCQVVPVLNFDFLHLEELEERLKNPQSYSGIIFSSPRVVEAVGKCIKNAADWANLFAFTVGEKTASEVEQLGLKPSGSETGIGSALAEHILSCPDRQTLVTSLW